MLCDKDIEGGVQGILLGDQSEIALRPGFFLRASTASRTIWGSCLDHMRSLTCRSN
jgi:hypothetical protein